MSDIRVSYRAIGVIRSEHVRPEETPIQPIFASDCAGRVEVYPEYAEGLLDIEAYSHIYLIYHLHVVKETRLLTKPFLQDEVHGVFATRSPFRPNPIGLSIVHLVGREGNTLLIEGADILDGTPLLDIKPYTTRFDHVQTERNGWHDKVDDAEAALRGVRNYRKQKGNSMSILIVFNREPYDSTDVTWNGLRLAGKLKEGGQDVRLFLMNDSVDLARDVCRPPEGYDQDLTALLKELIGRGVPVKVCGTCMARCGIYRNVPYFDGAEKATMADLAEWVACCDKVMTF